ncbi:hypothetical protein JCM18918_3759 [Cutibacterium acnes JCM 18918]|nr:hypothetical protein JCM18918_3759 [Cutibacterium acnes JCM 18918]
MRNGAGVDDVDHIRFGLDVLLGGDTTNGLAQSGDGARPRDDAGSPYTMGMKDRSSAMLWMAWTVISGPIPAGSPSVIPRSGVFGMVLLSFIV